MYIYIHIPTTCAMSHSYSQILRKLKELERLKEKCEKNYTSIKKTLRMVRISSVLFRIIDQNIRSNLILKPIKLHIYIHILSNKIKNILNIFRFSFYIITNYH